MPKRTRAQRAEVISDAVARRFAELDYDPLARQVARCKEEILIDRDQLDDPVVRAMLGDYSVSLTEDGRVVLRPRDAHKIDAELMQYAYPKMRTTQVSGEIAQSITVKIMGPGGAEPMKTISVPRARNLIGGGDHTPEGSG
jgi:hypothetical protein